ncbi:MAG: YicC family protein [Deltaproteobacteria bacterium]|nr:YicC family protein [Deltaproteobacteria bacterium]PWB65421.1 MAG: YicC family protein [Deltaproteobacteria bacterium]
MQEKGEGEIPMWMSMTGFGRGEAHLEDVAVTADIRSINHRFLDIHVRCPSKFLPWEPRIRGLVRRTLSRGKVDVFLNVREWGKTGTIVRVNRPLLASFLRETALVREETGLPLELTFRDLLGVPDLFVFSPEGEDPAEELWGIAEAAMQNALSMLQASRREEGQRLRQYIGDAVAGLARMAGEMESLAKENKEFAVARFKERIQSISGEAGVDPVRLHQEASYLVDKLDITEECDRLKSHLAGLSNLLDDAGESVGKRFDFLVQEVFRELNTASNKSAHARISSTAVAAKTELEKIREQIQNVE